MRGEKINKGRKLRKVESEDEIEGKVRAMKNRGKKGISSRFLGRIK